MITDSLLQLDAANALIRAAATYTSTNTIDLSVNREIGAGEPLKMLYNVDVAFAGGTSVQPQIITSAAANLGTPTVIDAGITILTAALVQGALFARYIPEIISPIGAAGGVGGLGSVGQRYFGVQYVSVGVFTVGSISARIVVDAPDVKIYPVGYVIL